MSDTGNSTETQNNSVTLQDVDAAEVKAANAIVAAYGGISSEWGSGSSDDAEVASAASAVQRDDSTVQGDQGNADTTLAGGGTATASNNDLINADKAHVTLEKDLGLQYGGLSYDQAELKLADDQERADQAFNGSTSGYDASNYYNGGTQGVSRASNDAIVDQADKDQVQSDKVAADDGALNAHGEHTGDLSYDQAALSDAKAHVALDKAAASLVSDAGFSGASDLVGAHASEIGGHTYKDLGSAAANEASDETREAKEQLQVDNDQHPADPSALDSDRITYYEAQASLDRTNASTDHKIASNGSADATIASDATSLQQADASSDHHAADSARQTLDEAVGAPSSQQDADRLAVDNDRLQSNNAQLTTDLASGSGAAPSVIASEKKTSASDEVQVASDQLAVDSDDGKSQTKLDADAISQDKAQLSFDKLSEHQDHNEGSDTTGDQNNIKKDKAHLDQDLAKQKLDEYDSGESSQPSNAPSQADVTKADQKFEDDVSKEQSDISGSNGLKQDETKVDNSMETYEGNLVKVQDDLSSGSKATQQQKSSDEDNLITSGKSVEQSTDALKGQIKKVDGEQQAASTDEQNAATKFSQAQGSSSSVQHDQGFAQAKNTFDGGFGNANGVGHASDSSSSQSTLGQANKHLSQPHDEPNGHPGVGKGQSARDVASKFQAFNQQHDADAGQHNGDFENAVGDYATGKHPTPNNDTTASDSTASKQYDSDITHAAQKADQSPAQDDSFQALKNAIRGDKPTDEVGKKHDRMKVGQSGDMKDQHTVQGDLDQYGYDQSKLNTTLTQHDHTGDQYQKLQNETTDVQHDQTQLQHDQSNLCFVTGTMIKTVTGEKAVEDLNVGDVAITASGERKPIAWIGHQDVIFGQKDEKPVCVKANAIADGVPYKDLYTSAAHAYAFTATASGLFGKSTKDVFVRASAMVNGSTVVSTDMRRATYWHIELEGGHNILVANGAAAESFADHGERSYFTNASSAKVQTVTQDCLPRMKRGKYVRAVRRILNSRQVAVAASSNKAVKA